MMLTPPTFKSKNLIFRALDLDKDKDFVHELSSDPTIMLNSDIALPNPGTRATTDAIIGEMSKAALTFIACFPATGTTPEKPIGWAHLFVFGGPRAAHHRVYDFGLQLLEEHRNRGYGFELLYALFDHAFRHMHAHRVQGNSFAWNEPALKLYRKLGMVEEGIGRSKFWQDGAWRDEVTVSLLDTDWAEFKAKREREGLEEQK